MRYNKQVFISTEGHQHYQIVDENNFIIGVVTGFDKETNKKHAELFEKAPQMQSILETIRDLVTDIETELNNYGDLPIDLSIMLDNKFREIYEYSHNLLGK
jgi:mevalonate kinase